MSVICVCAAAQYGVLINALSLTNSKRVRCSVGRGANPTVTQENANFAY